MSRGKRRRRARADTTVLAAPGAAPPAKLAPRRAATLEGPPWGRLAVDEKLALWRQALTEQRLGRAVLVVALGLGAILRLWLAFNDDGIYWPDEIYQSLEPAHRLVFGYGVVAWEFREGARSWVLPGFCAALFKLASLIGLGEPRGYLGLTKVVFSAIGVATAWATFRLARTAGASSFAAACGAALFALAAPAIYFAPRAMAEIVSGLPVALGFAFALRPDAGRRERLLGASLLGFAVFLRLQTGLFCVGLLAILAARRQWRFALEAGGMLVGLAFLFGLLDLLTWGGWFQSALMYVRYNVVEAKSELYGIAPFTYYAQTLWTSMPWPILVIVPLAALAYVRAPGLVLTALAFFLLHSAVPHKDLRFIFPLVPVLCALAGVGLEEAIGRWPGVPARALSAAVLGAALISAATFHSLTFGDLGAYLDPGYRAGLEVDTSSSAYDYFGPANRLLLAARQQPDLCGLKIEGRRFAWAGGYTYLHRPVPMYPNEGPARESGAFNYVITPAEYARTGELIAEEGNLALLRVQRGPCVREVRPP